jgi:UDP-glucose 4-epimerase
VIEAVLLAAKRSAERYAVYNVATDYITVTEIAKLAAECAGLDPMRVQFEYTGGDRGWKGDVPIVRLNTDRIRRLGWVCGSSSKKALHDSMMAMMTDFKAGLL